MDTTYFFNDVKETKNNRNIIEELNNYSQEKLEHVYVIRKPLGTNYNYGENDFFVVLIPKHKIMFVDAKNEEDLFKDFYLDFIDDLSSLSDKYGYKEFIGRTRTWEDDLIAKFYCDSPENMRKHIIDNELDTKEKQRKVELITSLLVGSINDIKKTGTNAPIDLLDEVKRRIMIYDAQQADFIFGKTTTKVVTIQGLAGTGKTELLLRKLKELYTQSIEDKPKIAFTCYSKVLSNDLKQRINNYFDFLKVEEQIKWEENLFVMRGWGSSYNPNSGLYSYICQKYHINFIAYSFYFSFSKVCSIAIEELKKKKIDKCFDYILIDEGQDFPNSFVELCKLITKRTIYIAGDIFQNITDNPDVNNKPTFLLNKCYRTSPQNLLFAHSLGMGLIDRENPSKYLRWLTDEQWKLCGYDISRNNNKVIISRKPIRRFDDAFSNEEPITVIKGNYHEYGNIVIDIIDKLKEQYSSLTQNDICISFLELEDDNYRLIEQINSLVYTKYRWTINYSYKNKRKNDDELYGSNIYNVKGLEFPFVICFCKNPIPNDMINRNAIYMMLTRSFIKSFLIVSDKTDENNYRVLESQLANINSKGAIEIVEPSEEEKQRIINQDILINHSKKTYEEIALEEMNNLNIPNENRKDVIEKVAKMVENEVIGLESIRSAIQYIWGTYNVEE